MISHFTDSSGARGVVRGTQRVETTEVEAASEVIDKGIHGGTRRPHERSSRWRQAVDPRQTKS